MDKSNALFYTLIFSVCLFALTLLTALVFFRETVFRTIRLGVPSCVIILLFAAAGPIFLWVRARRVPQTRPWLGLKLASSVVLILSIAGLCIFRIESMALGVPVALILLALAVGKAKGSHKRTGGSGSTDSSQHGHIPES